MYLYGPAGLPLAVSDGGDVASTLVDVSQFNVGALLVPVNKHLSAIDVTSVTPVPGNCQTTLTSL